MLLYFSCFTNRAKLRLSRDVNTKPSQRLMRSQVSILSKNVVSEECLVNFHKDATLGHCKSIHGLESQFNYVVWDAYYTCWSCKIFNFISFIFVQDEEEIMKMPPHCFR